MYAIRSYYERLRRLRQINLQLAALDQPGWQGDEDNWLEIADDMLRNYSYNFV